MSTVSSTSSNKRFAVYQPSHTPPQRSRDERLSSTSSSTSSQPTTTNGAALKICAVCGDKSTGMHFGAMTCEGCKGFFRRSVQKKGNFVCLFEGSCSINKLTRKHCQSCRYKSCLRIGMKTELVMTEAEVNEKRELIRRNREKRLQQQKLEEEQRKQKEKEQKSADAAATAVREAAHKTTTQHHHPPPQLQPIQPPPMRMTMEQKVLIEVLLKGHQESYDFDYKEFESFRGLNHILAPENKPSVKNESFAWLVASLNRSNDDDDEEEETAAAIQSSRMKTDTAEEEEEARQNHSTRKVPAIDLSHASTRTAANCDVFHSLHGTDCDDEPSTSSAPPPPPTTNAVATTSTSFVVKSEVEEQATCSDVASTSKSDSAPEKTDERKDTESMKYLHGLLRSQGFSLSMLKDSKSILLLQHFCDIMSWGIRKVIEFCKGIPEFISLTLADQIFLLKGGCLEMLVLRSYFAFASDGNKYMSEKFQYQPCDFLKAGGSKEFVEAYNSLHLRMRKMKLQIEEICLLLALVLFSPDRRGLEQSEKVNEVQVNVALALQAFEYTHKPREKARAKYCEILLILPMMRTINKLFSENLEDLEQDYEGEMNPLIFEVNRSRRDSV